MGALVAYTALVPVPSNYHLDPTFRLWLFQNRPFIILGLIGIGLGTLWSKGLVKVSPELRLGLMFPLWTTLVAPVVGTPLPELALYWAWALFAFALVPQVARWRPLFAGFTVSYALFLMMILYLGRIELSGLPREATYGFLNEDYYGQIVQFLVISGLMWLYLTGHKSRLAIVIYAVATWHLFASDARNVVVFLVVTAVAYGWLRGRRSLTTHATAPMLAGAILVLVGVYASYYYPGQSANDVSSGRLQTWEEATRGIAAGDGLLAIDLLAGTDLPLPEGDPYDPLSEEATFTTTHVDNALLEILLKTGVVGLLLFIAPFVAVFRRGRRMMTTRWQALALAVFLGGAAQSFLASTVPTFGSPVGILFAVCATLPLQAASAPFAPSRNQYSRSRLAIGRKELIIRVPTAPSPGLPRGSHHD